MPQSYFQIYAHIVFSTKNREPLLNEAIRPRIHAYLATLARDFGCPFVHVGGASDHVHILADIGKKTLPVNLIAKMKQESSKFIKTAGAQYGKFYWQNGYGAFSVSAKDRQAVISYIDNQMEHHKKQSFQDELRGFLKQYGIQYDERYMWD